MQPGVTLLSAAAAYAFNNGKTDVLFMIGTDASSDLESALSVGFVKCGTYIAYSGIVF